MNQVFRFQLAFYFLTIFFINGMSAQDTRLLQQPAISANHIAFTYAGDLWLSDRNGMNVKRLTSFQGVEENANFSPDGKLIAFSAEYDGNLDVYTIPISGGEPKRMTWHPDQDIAKGWTPNGKHIVFASGRENAPINYPNHFYKVALNESGLETSLKIPRVWNGSFSKDGKKMAYEMILPWEKEWRNYRGGQNNPIRIIDLTTYETLALPWEGSMDRNPNWIGDEIYFLSDRDYAMNVWSYNINSKALKQVTAFKDFDCKNLASCADALVFENGGYLYTLDTKGGKPQKVNIKVEGDFPWARVHWENVDNSITDYSISPSGKRAIVAARGDVFSIPADKGDTRNLTNSSGAADRSPSCSPDGKMVAWFSDQSGEYQLVLADHFGKVNKTIALKNPTFYYTPAWSPDSKYISFGDANRNLWVVDVDKGNAILVDNEGFAHPERNIAPAWSPDSKWIAYTKRLKNEFNTIFIWSMDQSKSYQFTDGMSDSKSPVWDKSGKYLYFLSSTDYALSVGWLDLSSYGRPTTRSVYLAVLSSDEESPLKPISDEETKEAEAKKDSIVKVKIDFTGLSQRILALDVPAKNYGFLSGGDDGEVFIGEWQADPNITYGATFAVSKYKLKDKKSEEFAKDLTKFDVSADRKKVIYGTADNSLFIVDAAAPPKPGDGKLKLDQLQMKVDPVAEAKQIFKEAWRYQRDYFYVRNTHGLDLDWALKTYGPWVDHVRHRSDLNYILDIFGGETSVGHSFVGGGDYPDVDRIPVGLLGANYEIANGKYKFSKIFNGENWNPELKAPLTQPGIKIKEGDYLLAINDVPLDATKNIYSLFDRTAGKQTKITVNAQPSMSGAKDYIVIPVASESGLRQLEWVESNRRKVDQLSGGKLAYVWVPNTGGEGFTYFNRWYFAQKDKKGAIIDERWNQGGYIADYIIEVLTRTLFGYFNNPVGDKQPTLSQDAAIHGPKVMLINEMAGSGGDMLPYMFRAKNIGPLVGKKTWGGLVGIWDVPALIDGGGITAPRGGFYNLKGEWDVENKGVAPDIDVEMDPKLVNKGIDPQLEKAVQTAMELLKTQEVKLLPQPADPVRVLRAKQ